MEKKWVINVLYNKTYMTSDNEFANKIVGTSLGYDKYKQAIDDYDKIRKSGNIEFTTKYGKATFKVVMVELMNKQMYDKQQEGLTDGDTGNGEEGTEFNAENEGLNGEDESEAVEEVQREED